jgi:AraC-like DNA-binding protein
MYELLKPHRPTAEVKAVFGQIIACPLTKVGKSVFFQGKAAELIAYIWEQAVLCPKNNEPLTLHPYERAALEQAKELIETNLIEPVSVGDMATRVGLNRQKFKTGFKQRYQTTPHQYLIRCRMIQAQALMSEQGYSVTEAAIAVGYSNVSYFSRVFRQYYGQSPKSFRFGR